MMLQQMWNNSSLGIRNKLQPLETWYRFGKCYLSPSHLGSATATALAYDPSPLQDFCVAINDPKATFVFVNGKFCKDPKQVTAQQMTSSLRGSDTQGNTTNPLGSKVTPAFVDQFPGLNTLGSSMACIDFAPGGLNPPHTHPRGTEILVVAEGTLLVGFITSNQFNNTLLTKVLYKGDVFVFPIGLIHFQLNSGNTPALAFAALSSQNPGVITIANAVFGSKLPISADVLTKAFQLDKKVVDYLQVQFRYDNN
ncbi:germin-like protein subfamily 1 member 17 [Rhodamnia argentea]|uniref:Germin-like protein n=1 Tax=Rhodamnia argentea TaxID=178133 RepID=A0ABM3HG49_9MYRT|nr:germin-like protein subfamily 1 member 17 [Rhodamnia argentea]